MKISLYLRSHALWYSVANVGVHIIPVAIALAVSIHREGLVFVLVLVGPPPTTTTLRLQAPYDATRIDAGFPPLFMVTSSLLLLLAVVNIQYLFCVRVR